MRSIRFALAACVLFSSISILTGFSEDNGAKITALPAGSQAAPPKSQKEYMEQAKSQNLGTQNLGGSAEYPGASKK